MADCYDSSPPTAKKKPWKEASKSKTTVKYLILLYLADFSHVGCFNFYHRWIRGQTHTWQTYTSYFNLCKLRAWIVAWSNESSKSIVSVASACENCYCASEIYNGMEFDRLGEMSPEKDCCWCLTFQHPGSEYIFRSGCWNVTRYQLSFSGLIITQTIKFHPIM